MAALSPNGRFLAAAAFTADVKIWEVVYGKDNQVKEVVKVMQLKGHKVSCFLELKCCLCLLLDRVTLLLLAVSVGLTLLLHGSYRK
jgi:hypothetical protein